MTSGTLQQRFAALQAKAEKEKEEHVARLHQLHADKATVRLEPPAFSRQSISDAGGLLYIEVLLDTERIGLVRVADVGAELELSDIQVDPALHKKGYGTQVLGTIERIARDIGFSAIVGTVTDLEGDNVDELISWYTHRGYDVRKRSDNPDWAIRKPL
jgi:GNAT superfamily N-acetyltransferase